MTTADGAEPCFYFAYGSNMSARQMGERCPGAESMGLAVAEGWQLRFDRPSRRWGGHVADIVETPGSATWGVLWRVTTAHLAALDGFEGVATGAYRRINLVVEQPDHGDLRAESYAVCEPGDPGHPSIAYLEVILEGAMEHQLPGEYVRQLRGFAEA